MANQLTFRSDITPEPSGVETPGIVNGVVIVTQPNALDWILDKIRAWFDDRDEIMFVDAGHSDKVGDGVIILEWDQYQIDPLFVKILENEDQVNDYTVYSYGTSEGGEG